MQANDDLRVYRLDRDIEQVLHNIVNVFNSDEGRHQSWGLNPKEEVWVNIRYQGGDLELRVESLKGGWRTTVSDVVEMEKYATCMKDCLTKAEKDIRDTFKDITGKSLRWGKGKEWVNYEPVAMNGLYKFYAHKTGPVRVVLDRQKFVEKGPDIVTGEKKGEKDLLALITLPEKWRY